MMANEPIEESFTLMCQRALKTDPLMNIEKLTHPVEDKRSGEFVLYRSKGQLASRNTSYVYDNNGNLSRLTDRKSQVTSYTYDALNRLTLVTYADNSTTSYIYDGGNRLTQMVDSISGTITYTYDNLESSDQRSDPARHGELHVRRG